MKLSVLIQVTLRVLVTLVNIIQGLSRSVEQCRVGVCSANVECIEKAIRTSLDADDTAEPTPSWLIRQALARYTRAPAYLEAIIAGADRIDLNGEVVEPVTQAAITQAKTQRDEQKARAAERRRAHAEAAAEQKRREKLEKLADRFNQ
jgi:ProP effector